MKNLILGVAKGYDWYKLEPFVNSFMKNCPRAEVVLFVDDISDFTREKLLSAGVIAEKFPYAIEGIPNNTRWKIFRDFLDEHGNEYGQIFITDVRDVIFQADVFDRFKDCKNWLCFATEYEDIRGSKTGDRVNYDWIKDCLGKDEADKLLDKQIICCGTVIGSAAEMKLFCRELWKILEYKTTDIFDQAITNYLVYNGLLPIENLYVSDVNGGEFLTCALIEEIQTRGEFILRGDGGVPAVVHQYDRVEALKWFADELYCDKNISFDARFTDPRSLLEQCCCLLLADKIAELADVLSGIEFDGALWRDQVRRLLKIWSGALNKPRSRPIDVIELAVQNALFAVGVENFSAKEILDLQEILAYATENNRVVDNRLKFAFANLLLKCVRESLAAGTAEECFRLIDWLNQLKLPPDENFLRIVDEANRVFGRNRSEDDRPTKNLILGVAKGYDRYTLEPFVNSWRKNCPSAELVLFVDDISDFTRDKLIREGVRLEPFTAKNHPVNARWKNFLDYLEAHDGEYDQVFLTDTRDVIFQADVFERFKNLSNWLGCVTEADDIRGSKTGDRCNYKWLVDYFGKDVADRLADQKIICAGTIIGTNREMKIFLAQMSAVLNDKADWGPDQALLNFIVRENLLPVENLYEIDVDGGEILTCGFFKDNQTRGDKILRSDGGIPAVVHQYDRVEALDKLVDETYRDRNFSFDERFNDPRSVLEQNIRLLLAGKVDETVATGLSCPACDKVVWRSHVGKVLKIWSDCLNRPPSRLTETVGLAMQNALVAVGMGVFSAAQILDVQSFLARAVKENRAVDDRLKLAFANRLVIFVREAIETRAAAEYFQLIDWLNQLKLPPDEKFQRLVDEANQLFGRGR